MKNINLVSRPWEDYELLDSGNNRKLERFGNVILVRPETQAIWKPTKADDWNKAHAEFFFEDGKGKWKGKVPEQWEISWEDAKIILRPTAFKHIGIFPEQVPNWAWVKEKISSLKSPEVLNLFGYTGIASISAAKSGAIVTHVDASKQSNEWAKENADLSGIPVNGIRYILDDALKFVEREARRGSKYDGIILDPPAFGRGAKGEIWKIEESLQKLLFALKEVFTDSKGSFFLLNGYAAGYSEQSFLQVMEDVFGLREEGEYGELRIEDRDGKRSISSGIFVRF